VLQQQIFNESEEQQQQMEHGDQMQYHDQGYDMQDEDVTFEGRYA
jgi:hypothetical protein